MYGLSGGNPLTLDEALYELVGACLIACAGGVGLVALLWLVGWLSEARATVFVSVFSR